ncbi:MAG TPA: nuclear transport factor 2 family protein [Candidatus Acidoferrum sp.]|nr:nuclear transport factor 2 family protein [Candidatus Acidoferrum sp.]
MLKIRFMVALAVGLLLASSQHAQQDAWRDACIQRCVSQPTLGDPEVQRQEITSLEREAAHAIQLSNGTFFRRVYSDEFAGTLSHGQQINRDQWIAAVETASVKRESFNVSDIKVRIFQETAVATCLWSSRFIINGQHLSSQLRVIHVYVNTPNGWHVISGQTTNLPPDVQQVL